MRSTATGRTSRSRSRSTARTTAAGAPRTRTPRKKPPGGQAASRCCDSERTSYGRPRKPWPPARVRSLRVRRAEREGQRLGVRTGAERVGALDELLERDVHVVVGDRGGPRGLRERDAQRLGEGERTVGQERRGRRDRQGRVTGGGDDVGRGGGRVVVLHARDERAERGGRAQGERE